MIWISINIHLINLCIFSWWYIWNRCVFCPWIGTEKDGSPKYTSSWSMKFWMCKSHTECVIFLWICVILLLLILNFYGSGVILTWNLSASLKFGWIFMDLTRTSEIVDFCAFSLNFCKSCINLLYCYSKK
jgi:hypothetical protein